MPELPDVVVFQRYLDATALHQRIDNVDVRDRDLLEGVSSQTLRSRLEGAEFESTSTHGKNLFVQLCGDRDVQSLGTYCALLSGMPVASLGVTFLCRWWIPSTMLKCPMIKAECIDP
jgi:hypothetical protein